SLVHGGRLSTDGEGVAPGHDGYPQGPLDGAQVLIPLAKDAQGRGVVLHREGGFHQRFAQSWSVSLPGSQPSWPSGPAPMGANRPRSCRTSSVTMARTTPADRSSVTVTCSSRIS